MRTFRRKCNTLQSRASPFIGGCGNPRCENAPATAGQYILLWSPERTCNDAFSLLAGKSSAYYMDIASLDTLLRPLKSLASRPRP